MDSIICEEELSENISSKECCYTMFLELYIENYLLLKKVHLDLESSFLVFTGETGAGKSMVITAMAQLLGKINKKDCIGPFGSETKLVGIFRIPSGSIEEKIKEMGISLTQGELEIKRSFVQGKRSRTFINGVPASQTILKELGDLIIDFHSQDAQRQLLSPRFHGQILDHFLGLGAEVKEYQRHYQRYVQVSQDLERLKEQEKSRLNRMEFLEFQIQELETAQLRKGEKDQLFQRYQQISHGAEIGEKVAYWLEALLDGDESAATMLARASRDWQDYQNYEPRFQELSQVTEEAQMMLGQMGYLLREIQENLVWDPEELQELEERLAFLESLERKYHREIDDLVDHLQEMKTEYERLSSLDESREGLEKEKNELYQKLMNLGEKIRQKRQKGALSFQKVMEKELSCLGMKTARFKVEIENLPNPPGPRGLDKIEFLVQTNEGLPFGPLGEISSGGELSRIMLTLKAILSEEYQIPIMIFDEIDSGVGGRLGQVLGKKLKDLSLNHQILVITHLPQLAAMGKSHYKIEKKKEKGKTITEIYLLEGEERKKEIAEMMRGKKMTQATLKEAEELLQRGTI
ncbi:MAG: DNA repair protein RecN [Planctomycetota bacterium]|nr:MAG: DNA repair protein RecN [Planctomycetota bacterium]